MENNNCPNCGKPLTDSTLQGLCPECLMKAGWPTEPSTRDGGRDFTPPEIGELEKCFPHLEITEQIGKGGMGAVYKARQPELDRFVALKILIPKDPQDPGFAERFTREARALAKLSHPHIVAVYDFGHRSFCGKPLVGQSPSEDSNGAAGEAGDVESIADGAQQSQLNLQPGDAREVSHTSSHLHYFIMEYVDGPNLRDIEKAGEMSPREALQIIPQICEALQFAHDEGIVHRDIKPENILLDRKGRVKIADFGLAKILGHEPQELNLTLPGHIMGTPHYMAPEQIEHPQNVDHRADIYSLGVVFYEMLTGELPLGKFAPPSRKVQVDVRLDEVVLRTLEKEPQRRYQQASQVSTEVQTIVTSPQDADTNELRKILLDDSPCYISTPEYLRSFRGRFFNIYHGKGRLRLDHEALSFRRGWQSVTIPLSAIRSLDLGTYPLSAKPVPLNFIAVTFTEHGATRTLLFTPCVSLSPGQTNETGDQWMTILQDTVQVSTGRSLSIGRLEVTQKTSWWDYLKLYLFLAATSTPGFAIIPLMLEHRLPNRWIEWLPGPLFAILMFFMCLTMPRWMGWLQAKFSSKHQKKENSSQPVPDRKPYNPWEPTIIFAGTIFFVVLFLLGIESSRPFVLPLILLSIVGMTICVVSWMGRWPFPSPLFPEPNFSSRNLRENKRSIPPIVDSNSQPSHAAIAGAVWIGLAFLNIVLSYTPLGWSITTPIKSLPLGWIVEVLVFVPLTLLGFSAPVGAPLLGVLALHHIRQSEQRCRGLGLALFDLLSFPLLGVNAWLVWLTKQVSSQINGPSSSPGHLLNLPGGIVVILLLVLLSVNGAVILTIKRIAKRYINRPPMAKTPAVSGTWKDVWKSVARRFALLLIVCLPLDETLRQISVGWRESTGELWSMGLAVFSLGGLVWVFWPGYRLKRSLVFVISATIAGAFLMLALANFYAWYLRPNLGLYREPDWVAQHPGFQQQQQEAMARRLWANKITVTNLGTPLVEVGTLDSNQKVRLGQNGVAQFNRKARIVIGDALIRVGQRMEVTNRGTGVISVTCIGDQEPDKITQLGENGIGYFSLLTPIRIDNMMIQFGRKRKSKAIETPEISSFSTPLDFNDPNFWQAQIVKHLEGVRTLDCELIMERQSFGEDQNTPERRSRTRFDLKWDRDHQWIDCTAEPIDRKGITQRILCGSQVEWISHGNNDWTKVKASAGGMMTQIFFGFGEMRKHPYEHAFSIAQGIVCSDMIKRTQDQGVIDWKTIKLAHRRDDQGRHVLTCSMPMPLAEDKVVNAELVLVGIWERDAFKLLELRGRIPKLGIDQLAETFEDHLYAKGTWVPQHVTLWGWENPKPDKQGGLEPMKLHDKTVIMVQRMTANQPMTAAMFDGFEPPIGDTVSDKITGTHYRVWPDFEKIRASGGKERVSVMGRVYLDGRPEAGITVTTLTLYDPNSETHRVVKATTDANGQFCLDGLIPGFSYRILATHTSGYTAKTEARLSELGMDTTDLKIDMTSGLSVRGTVTDPNGRPLPKALVHFQGKPIVKTNDQGHYTVNGLYADQGYEVEAVAWGHAPLDPGGEVTTSNFRIQRDEDGQVKPFDIVLRKECVLSGRVVDQNDQPIQGVRVNVWSSPFGTSEVWKWYDAHTDTNGIFRIGNLGDRIYTFFVGQYGNVSHSPKESPILFRVTGNSFMPDPMPGRRLVDANIAARVESFEHPYRSYFRLKEFQKASSKNELIHDWINQLYEGDIQQRCEALARLGSVPAYGALNTYTLILGGQPRERSTPAGTVIHSDSNMSHANSTTICPDALMNSQDSAIVCLTMRAVARCGFVEDHASLLIQKLDDPNQTVRDYAQVALAELTGVSLGANRTEWQAWLDRYQQDRSDLDTRSPERLFMDICRICRNHKPSPQSIEGIMAAWQGASDGAAAFRTRLSKPESQGLWQCLAAVDIDSDSAVQSTLTSDYWPTDMFNAKGYRNYDLKIRFTRACSLSGRTFKPGVWYTLPALFRDAYIGQWEIVDLRFDDLEAMETLTH